ncbi:uroporphyrinogen-III synthase hemD domain-containing protein [Hirsutella rhossiliensis]|uniref:Uroporphyrinogen-III synthase hemD domain-containing protein n=1 Tax=Hirsutella rhossiliensis TaxID=111463 RepID=A0A9P8SCT5_9HYPO|nr:uroporphyrinogen-III synthase hemD domain-containing protein [Hirsutella rhossiliensis]KAH0957978.1 uroporphyrinogen-III synthase hemD domain-containing protein [Hirsutella rhossiliensis]
MPPPPPPDSRAPLSGPSPSSPSAAAVPVLLLKTRSAPSDAYHELLSAASHGRRRFDPCFVPVLSHRIEDAGTARLRDLLHRRQVGRDDGCAYGGLIFTSQRAVEAFAQVVHDGKGQPGWPHLQDVPVYSVGPATTRALEAIPQQPPLQIFGQHCGNGDALARFILEHYTRHRLDARRHRPPLLFLVGEQRRDVIPRTLMDAALPPDERIRVDEDVVYGSGVMDSFPDDFASCLRRTDDAPVRWVVVFSPTGCDSMLRGLGLLDAATAKVPPGRRDGQTCIATIGPTTRAHLVKTFDFEPDVCADTPSPGGVLQAIVDYMDRLKDSRLQ